MKKRFLNGLRTMVMPAALALAVAAFAPAVVLAANHGGGFRGQGGNFGSGHSFSAPARGNFNGGHAYGGHVVPGRTYDSRVYNGGRGYYRPGFRFGFGVGVYPAYPYVAPAYGYGYAVPVPVPACNPAGFYDQAGNWQYYQGCVLPPPNADEGYGAGGPPPDPPQQ